MPSHKVTLQPSGHQFLCSEKQTLLHAGLESGLNLKYGCDGGNCGDCKARLISGSLSLTGHSDFCFSKQEKRQNYFLMCRQAATTDLVVEAVERGNVQEIAQQQIKARVYRIAQLTEDVIQVSFKTPRSQPLQFFAGQYMTVRFADGRFMRNKSIASCPCDQLNPQIHVKFRADDPFSDYVFHQLKKNETALLEGPNGDFVLDDDSNRPIILIAYDTGFASIKSLLEHALALEKEQPIYLYWLLTPGHSPYLKNFCQSISDAFDQVQFQEINLQSGNVDETREVLRELIASHSAAKYCDIYATLPSQYHQTAQSLFVETGIDDRHWRIDQIQKINAG